MILNGEMSTGMLSLGLLHLLDDGGLAGLARAEQEQLDFPRRFVMVVLELLVNLLRAVLCIFVVGATPHVRLERRGMFPPPGCVVFSRKRRPRGHKSIKKGIYAAVNKWNYAMIISRDCLAFL